MQKAGHRSTRLGFALGWMGERIRINAMRKEVHRGRSFWMKRRRLGARAVLLCANGFFQAASAPLRAIVDTESWQQWELNSFRLLHGAEFESFLPAPATVAAEEVPGINLTVPLDGGWLTGPMAAAAGRELRRAHNCSCAEFAGLWSHGDPHLGNFVFNEADGRARLIDFEVMHDRKLSAERRQADDLLVVLQDLAGRIDLERWNSCARAFLQGYDRPELLGSLSQILAIPDGLGRLWWMIRTGGLSALDWQERLRLLDLQD